MERKKRGYKRLVEKKRDYRLFAIACEGSVRERDYFECFEVLSSRISVDLIADVDEDGNIITKTNEDIKDYSYKKQLDYYLTYENGTMGWVFAFTEACNQCNLQSLNQYYRKLDWMESDYFDSLITDKIIETLFSERQENNKTYYMFRNNNFIKSKEGE